MRDNCEPKIRIRGLNKSFGANQVLRGLDLDVQAGESVAVIGGSGTGKSVLLKCVIGLLEPDAGTIELDGETVTGLSKTSREAMMARFGLLFQGSALFDSIPVLDNVAFGLVSAQQMPKQRAQAIALDKLAQVGLDEDVAVMYPAELSGGMRKRVALARTIASDPDILLFDEPTTGLDPIMGDVIDKLIVNCVHDLAATALTITHDMDSAKRISNRIAMLYGGRIIWSGPAVEVDTSGDPVVDQFVHGHVKGPITSG
ncbi:MAG: ABC transporter ATP-binding protein [Rhodospirillaceae bacterium]|nr:ABC transporter ATP-binding protein [Rhodospirillaceae bacterium]